jgi:flagellar biosynthesis protein FlhG
MIWTIGGGKGGSGKSFITANIGICLSKLGVRVILIDADLGGANLHTFLGIPPPNLSL